MIGVGTAGNGDDSDLAVFVDRLAAAGSDRPTAAAREQIRRAIREGSSPPGLRRLAEGLAASIGERRPSPRRPAEDASDASSVVDAMCAHSLVVCEYFDTAAVAGAIDALLADGRRIIVTGPSTAATDAVRVALPAALSGRVLDRLPALSPAELRELRRLLVLSTPTRRTRAGQALLEPVALPPVGEVADLCEQAARVGATAGVWMVPSLLAGLPTERRAALASVSRGVTRALDAMASRGDQEWAWSLLSDLIYTRHRGVFDRLMEDVAQAVGALDRTRYATQVVFTGPPLPDAAAILCRFRDFLTSGGRARSYFQSMPQRDVQPVLAQVRLGDETPATAQDVQRVIDHLELGERLDRIDAGCVQIGVAEPRNEGELTALADGLVRVGAAARSVGALRHDVLFLAEDSPLSVPDVETAHQVARAVLDFEEHGSALEAGRRLDAAAERLGALPSTMPEHRAAVDALRARDAAAYAAAVDALGAARRDVHDEAACRALLQRLAAASPGLAQAWTARAGQPAAFGLASFVPMETLLTSLPASDSADAVIVLGAGGLGVERLLLTAVAPRMIAVVAPGDAPEGSPTLLSVLRRASALVIRGRAHAGARVVPITRDAVTPAAVGQVGA